jgi:hypothetical protein
MVSNSWFKTEIKIASVHFPFILTAQHHLPDNAFDQYYISPVNSSYIINKYVSTIIQKFNKILYYLLFNIIFKNNFLDDYKICLNN